MSVKVAINGFGRIGRNILRASVENNRKDIEVVAINDLGSSEMNLHLLKYDSVHSRFPLDLSLTKNYLKVNNTEIEITAEKDPAKLPWSEVDVALECTGIFTDKEKASLHLNNGSKKVLISAPASNVDCTVVFGVNHESLTSTDVIVSNASCTTNCLAPVVKVLHESFGIEVGYMTTIHSYTGDQPVLDTLHKDYYRARAASLNMIPTSTGAAQAVSLVLPELKGKLDGSAIRVPTPNVSCVDLKCVFRKESTVEQINDAIEKASNTTLNGILAYEEAPLVSSDFNHHPASSIFAGPQTKVLTGGMTRVLSWYDNEWGFSNRMLDTAAYLGRIR
ncbi:MAG: type I glyceraldehyde-3-phosphate dehydrogenase [Paracoccaceae bacterium]|jgi:glyceraldehyde 3-phosphate dehydrogenase|nr:MAG: type I glyceraldehyde-3-phosphate dehydrogenase [Alphaproteobacteria bacterium]|tara:strand:+ start:1753 stop:2754 length:1002 start_codon:yes stop_codon:yes gene_type:complete